MEVEQKVAAVHKYVAAFANSDMNLIEELYAEDAVIEDPVGTDPLVGIEAVRGFYERAFGMGIALELTGAPRCCGNAVAFPFRVRAAAMQIEIIDVFEFNEQGKVCNMRAYWGPDNTLE